MVNMILRRWWLILFCIAGCGRNSVSQNFQSTERVIGCNNIVVYWLGDDSQSYYRIYLDVNKTVLNLVNTFEVSEELVNVVYAEFDNDISGSLCNDLRPANNTKVLKEIIAKRGKVKVSLTNEDLALYKSGLPYVVEMEFISIQFDDNSLISKNLGKIDVGWMPG